MISTILLYIITFSIILYFANKQDEKSIKVAYVLMFLLTACRFDIGNDYFNYFNNSFFISSQIELTGLWATIKDWSANIEPSFVLFCAPFNESSYPFVWVNMIYSAILVVMSYYSFDYFKCHFSGLFFIFVSEFIFLSWDWIRQGAAIAIVLFSLRFIKEKKLLPFALTIIAAAFLHRSAVIFSLAYPLSLIKSRNSIYVSIIFASVLAMWLGVSELVVSRAATVFDYLDSFSTYSDSYHTMVLYSSVFYKIRLTCYAVFCIVLTCNIPKEFDCFKAILVVGIVLYVLAFGSLSFSRGAWYFLIVIAILSGVSLSSCSNNNNAIYFKVCIVLMIAFFIFDLIEGKTRGCSPYDSIFSDNFKNLIFRTKTYH